MNSDNPLFFGRLGGSDYDTVIDYFGDYSLKNNQEWVDTNINKVKRFNGYFDFDNNEENFITYLDTLLTGYKNSDAYTYCGSRLIRQFDANMFTSKDSHFIDAHCENKICINYGFIEFMNPFLSSMDQWMADKKVLIISPFSDSINHQFKNKDFLYHDFKFPNFELLTYNTKITYSNSDEDNRESLKTNTNNWLEEAEMMANEISKIDFDIALLSCGSYAMYLGNFIKTEMKKKSLYFGGILNMYFNIYGGRFGQSQYQPIYESSGLNVEYYINPLENMKIQSIKSGRGKSSESLGAYFGYRNRNV
jgi:hypothetical protein